MDDHVLRALGEVRFHIATNQWSLIAPDGSVKTISTSKMRYEDSAHLEGHARAVPHSHRSSTAGRCADEGDQGQSTAEKGGAMSEPKYFKRGAGEAGRPG
jgi:hypothetical protein